VNSSTSPVRIDNVEGRMTSPSMIVIPRATDVAPRGPFAVVMLAVVAMTIAASAASLDISVCLLGATCAVGRVLDRSQPPCHRHRGADIAASGARCVCGRTSRPTIGTGGGWSARGRRRRED
jgi:hypothetical protein